MKRVLAAAILIGLTGAASAQILPISPAEEAMIDEEMRDSARATKKLLESVWGVEEARTRELCKPSGPCGSDEMWLCFTKDHDLRFGCDKRIAARKAAEAAAKAAADAKRFNSEWCNASATCMRERAAAAQK